MDQGGHGTRIGGGVNGADAAVRSESISVCIKIAAVGKLIIDTINPTLEVKEDEQNAETAPDECVDV